MLGHERRLRGPDQVSILVLLDMALMQFRAAGTSTVFQVSILVLLDMALMRDPIPSPRPAERGFNPCFTGYGSDARSGELDGSIRDIVSILVLLDMALMQRMVRSSAFRKSMFQSLFYWIWL